MVGKLVKSCTDCSSLEDAICTIDKVLAQYGKNAWQNIAFLTTERIPYLKVRQLIYYRQILANLKWDQNFYCPYDLPTILSRAMALVAGEFVPKALQMPIYAVPVCRCEPTTTTTTSTSTTSTSSTTTTTTTTLGPALWDFNNFLDSEIVLTGGTYGGSPLQSSFPITPGQSGVINSQFEPAGADLILNITGPIKAELGTVQCVVAGTNTPGLSCQLYAGSGTYTFSDVVFSSNPGGAVIQLRSPGVCLEGSGCASTVPAGMFVLDDPSCSGPSVALFCAEGEFSFGTGSVVYTDSNGTVPLTGHTTIMLLGSFQNSDVFNISSSTGVVGTSLGPCT